MTTSADTLEQIKSLEKLGLSENEAQVYFACLGNGETTIMELVRLTKLHRTTIYGVVEDLAKIGLLKFFIKSGHRIYSAEPPRKIKSYLEKQKREIESRESAFDLALPQLNMAYSTSDRKPVISFYQGQEEIRGIFEDVLTSGAKEVLFVCNIGVIEDVLGEQYLKKYVKRIVSEGIVRRGIYAAESLPEEKLYRSGKENLRSVKLGPVGLQSPVYTGIYQNKVFFVSSAHEAYGVVIESKDMHDSMKSWFESLWKVSRSN